ncbi:hypothetical protein AB0L22_08790 [Micromonospora haikouensis]|uniref:hypothetical protein n=1 Tax=Micromonospora haikouensis TaxID=686309 RepID=UPI00343FA1EC
MTLTLKAPAAVDLHGRPDVGLYDPDMPREELVGAQEVRDNFAEVMRKVREGEAYVVVLRRSKVEGAFIPRRWLDRLKELGITDEPATYDE